jgi:molybdopterin converting factor small subunit
VQVVVRLFAGLRDQAGTSERTLEIPDDATVAAVWQALGLEATSRPDAY